MEFWLFLLLLYWVYHKIEKKKAKNTPNQKKHKETEIDWEASKKQNGDKQRVTNEQAAQDELKEIKQRAKRRLEQKKAERGQTLSPAVEKRLAELEAEGAPAGGEGYSAYTPVSARARDEADRQEYEGSMNAASTEGEDVCDPSLGHHSERVSEPDPQSVYANQIGGDPFGGEQLVDISPRGLVRAVVMSEVLKRPCERVPR